MDILFKEKLILIHVTAEVKKINIKENKINFDQFIEINKKKLFK